jgi:hypothetical protein
MAKKKHKSPAVARGGTKITLGAAGEKGDVGKLDTLKSAEYKRFEAELVEMKRIAAVLDFYSTGNMAMGGGSGVWVDKFYAQQTVCLNLAKSLEIDSETVRTMYKALPKPKVNLHNLTAHEKPRKQADALDGSE